MLEELLADDRMVTAVVKKAHYQRRYLASLRETLVALDSLVGALAKLAEGE